MPYPRPIAASGLRAVLYFNSGKAGWTERYFWVGDARSWSGLEADLAVLVRARLQLLTEKTTLLGARLGRWPEGAGGTRLLLREPFAGVGEVIEDDNAVAGPWESAKISAYDATHVYRRDYTFRALSRTSMRWSPTAGGQLTPNGQAQASDLIRVLNNDAPGGRQRGLWCVLGDVKDPAVTGRQRITRLGSAGAGCATEVATARPPLWKEGDVVKLADMGKCSPRGMAGPALVLAVAGLVTTVAQEPACCHPEYRVGPRATVELQTQALYAQASAVPTGISRRALQPAFRRMTWAPAQQVQPGCCAPVSTGVECLAVHPCGVVMELLTVAYAARMRTFQGRDPSPVVWFEAPPGAKVYEDETLFRSRMYSGDFRAYAGVGEQMRTCWSSCCHGEVLVGRACESRDGSAPAPYLGQTPCGPPDAWLAGGVPGLTPEIVTDRAGRPPCCLPLSSPGGQREGARLPLGDAGGEREGGVLHPGPTPVAGGEREGGVLHPEPRSSAGGTSEGGPVPTRPPGGEREGGAHLLGPTADRGGQRQGGTLAPGPRKPTGGEREGGAGHQVGPTTDRGGDREGGRVPAMPPGGEREGGTVRHGPTTDQGGQREGGRVPNLPPGGKRDGGRTPRLATGGQHEGGKLPGATAGGEADGGPAPRVVPGGQRDGGVHPRLQPGGEREGGRPPRTAAGGESEGGTHPTFLTATGGEREGGEVPGVGSGGQAEGGGPPGITGGGQSEGGDQPTLPDGGQSEGGALPLSAGGGQAEGGGQPAPPPGKGGEREGGPVAAAPPDVVTVPCCPNPLPAVLTLSFANQSAACACLTAPVALTWNPSSSLWEGPGGDCGGAAAWTFGCERPPLAAPGTFTLLTSGAVGTIGGGTNSPASCDPFLWSFPDLSLVCNGVNGSADVLIQ